MSQTSEQRAESARKAAATRAANKAAAESAASESVQALDLAAAIGELEIGKPQRVYVDVAGVPRVPTADGTLATVQREQRADGTLGEYLLAEIRTNRDKSESVTRYSIARVQALKLALDSASVTTLR